MQPPFNTGLEPGAWWRGDQLALSTQPSAGAIVGNTVQGLITSWSPAAERLYGYTAAEVIGKLDYFATRAARVPDANERIGARRLS